MSYKITSKCISCKLCISACPVNAIKIVDGHHWIDPNLCTNCVGTAYTVPQCTAGCPTSNGCVKEPRDYWESWFVTYNNLVSNLTKEQNYWDSWFNFYSQKFPKQLEQSTVNTQQLTLNK